MKTSNVPREQLLNTTTSTVITFPSNYDLTGVTGVSIPGISATGRFSVVGQTISIRWASTVNKNRTFTIVINGLKNASQPGSAAIYSIVGTLTSDLGTTKVTWPLAAPLTANATAVTSVVSVQDTASVSLPTTYTVGFNLGAQGRLSGTTAAGANTITITYPAGTTVPAGPSVSNVTINGITPAAVSVSGQTVTLTMPSGVTLVGGQAVTVVFKQAFGLINPATAGSYQLSVSTSAEGGAGLSSPYIIAPVVLTSVTLGSANQPTAGFAIPGQMIAVDGFSLQRTAGSNISTVSAIALINGGTAPSATISGVSVYQDGGDGVFGAGDTLLNTVPATFSSTVATVTFDPGKLQVISDSLPHDYWVVYTFFASSTNGQVASSQVTTFTTTSPLASVTAAQGAIFTVDTLGPTVSWTSPSMDATTIVDPLSTLVGGSAADAGAGVGWVAVKIKRDVDGLYWDGTAWGASATTLTAGGTLSWAYGWDLLPTFQNGVSTYTLYATGIDAVGNAGTTVVRSGIKIDNMGPTVTSAVALSGAKVDVSFSESLEPTTAAALLAAFSFNNGLSATAATLDASGKVVHLTTSAQVIGVNYTVTVVLGSLNDPVGNPSEAPNVAVFLSGAVPSVTVTQGVDPGNPSGQVYRTRNTTTVVDEIVLSASGGSATVATITVRGLDSVASLRSDVSTVTLFRDNGDGVFGSGDTLVSTSRAFSADASGTALTFTSVGAVVNPGSPASFWIVYNTGANPVNGHIVGSRVQSGDVAAATATVPAFANMTSANSGSTIVIDVVVPSTPGTITATPVSTGSVEITWTPSADVLSGMAFYNVYRDGSFLASSTVTTYTASGLNPGQSYVFAVSGVDVAGNESTRAVAAAVSLPTASLWMTITTPDPGQTLNLGSVTPGTPSAITSGTIITVGGVGANLYDLSISAADFTNTTLPSVPPTMPVSQMSYATRGWATVGPTLLSNSSSLVWSSIGTKYLWQQNYIFDYTLNVGYAYDPGIYTTQVTFTAVQN